jgi:hypothetical protein
MVSEGANPPAGDRLYRSSDSGTTWTEVLAATASIHDVVIRDAQNVIVATQIGTGSMTSITGGPSFASSDAGVTFTPLANAPQLACVAKRADGVLLGCGANWDPDFKAVAKSADGGATWDKVWRFVEMAGAVKCPEGTVEHDVCDVALWDCSTCMTDLKRQFGAKGPTCGLAPDITPPPKKGCCDGSGAEGSLMWLAISAWWLGRRARPRSTSSRAPAPPVRSAEPR